MCLYRCVLYRCVSAGVFIQMCLYRCVYTGVFCTGVCLQVCFYLDVDSCDEQRRVQRESAGAVHREELIHLLQTLPEDNLHTHTHTYMHTHALSCLVPGVLLPLLDNIYST